MPKNPVISKDGRTVQAYSWSQRHAGPADYELRLANLTGDPNPRRLYDNPDLDWIGPSRLVARQQDDRGRNNAARPHGADRL